MAALPGSEVLQDEAPWSFAHAHAPDPATCDVLEIVRPLDWALLVSAVVCGSSAALRWHPMRRFHRHAAFASCSHQRSLRRLHLRHTARRASHVLAGVARIAVVRVPLARRFPRSPSGWLPSSFSVCIEELMVRRPLLLRCRQFPHHVRV